MPQKVSESEIFVLLSKQRRRLTLRILRETSEKLTATNLAHHLASFEYESPSAGEVRTIYLALYHNHLPRLAEADVIEYNPNQGTIRPGKNFDTLSRYLEDVIEEELPWSDR